MYAKACASFHHLRADSELKARLYRTLIDTLIDSHRGKWSDSMAEIEASPPTSAQSRMSTGTRGADAQVLEALPASRVKVALQALPEEVRTAVYLADVEEFTRTEIADIMGTPIGTVNSCPRRGRRQVRRPLEDCARERGLVPAGRGDGPESGS